jgi:long-subunit acyl-CoA synthetase (AMP-forming)
METGTVERHASGGPGKGLFARNLIEAFHKTVEARGDDVAIRDRDGEFQISWNELRRRVDAMAGGLSKLGVSKGDTVALLTGNRPEFNVCDLAAGSLGAVPFSIYQTAPAEQIAYQVSDAGARTVIVEAQYLDRIESVRGELPDDANVIVLDGEGGTHTLEEVAALDPGFDVGPTVGEVAPDDLLTLIYTSGTTGNPKGVQLSHRNLMSLVSAVDGIIPFPESGGRLVSWLPTAHIAERGANYYLPIIRGLEVTICPDPRQIIEYLPAVRPTWFFAVPRIWEKLKAGLEARLGGLPDDERGAAEAGLAAGLEKVRAEQAGEAVPERVAKAVEQADEAVFSGLRAHLGLDQAVAVHTGAAPTPVDVLEFFHAIGIPLGELWGMSETCGVATCNPPERIKIGTVGPPIPGVEIKLAEDDEVFVRGDPVMVGYRNQPEKTAEVIDDEGWLATGDIGDLDDDGYLKIVDRKKELIINAAGKNMSPANIESALKGASPLIGQVIAVGDGRPYNTALIVLDPDYAPVWAAQNGLEGMSVAELATQDKLIEAIQAAVDEANQSLARVEQIKKFKVLPDDWPPGGDELTPTMKLKRKPIAEKYAEEIDGLYS